MTFAYIFDIAAACVLGFFIVRGAIRGLTGEIVSLLGLVASIVCGWTFAQPAADVVLTYFPNWDRTIAELACSVVIFMAVSLAFAALARIMRVLVKAANLSMIDHTLGIVSGAARAFFLVLFIYGAVSIFSPVVPSAWMQESFAMRGAAVVWPTVLEFLTDHGWISLDHLKAAATGTRTGTAEESDAGPYETIVTRIVPGGPGRIVSGEPGR